ncbi:MAG: PIG-L family deacetylase [Anaerolineae bacterium]|nr:PIG-L family deacetylase [Anaerolineae bacterium]
MAKAYQAIYLSPHFDDVALSCGGAIHRQTRAGQSVLVITVCAAPPPPGDPFSLFAQEMHAGWGNPADVVATRQAEDQAAMQALGAGYLHLHFCDCIYRGQPQAGEWYYADETKLFGQIHPADLGLAEKIATAIIEQAIHHEDTRLYAPLAVGHHVDHQLTHTAAWQLRSQGWPVIFYEDYPYADPTIHFGGLKLEDTLAELRQTDKYFTPRLENFGENNLRAKLDSIRAYASQLNMLFGNEAEIERQIRRYARAVGKGKLAERVWTPD